MVTVPLKGTPPRAGHAGDGRTCASSPARRWTCSSAPTRWAGSSSAAIENVLLLDAVLRSRRELENTFNSLADLVAVSDQDGRLVSMNIAFLERVGTTRQELIDRPIADVVGPATTRS